MIEAKALTSDLQKVVLRLEDDLRTRVEDDVELKGRWTIEHARAQQRGRTASAWVAWRDDRVTQAAVAWVLTSVFVRFCEDNALVRPVWIAGPESRRQEALDAQLAFFRTHPLDTDREWLEQAVAHLAALPATAALVDDHAALHLVRPSGEAVTTLLDFWREKREDGGLVRDFRDPSLDTRFLGDLYQDLSAHAKATYALLQTPVFVEEFILDRTLEPSLAERPLEGFRMIDPTCGSGHFLLGAFDRLLDRWQRHAPAEETQWLVQQALDAVHGVDLNPFAVAIARFRLTVAALQACGLSSLEQAPAFRFHLAVGDSLLHGPGQQTLDDLTGPDGFAYATEDLTALESLLSIGRYDVVVGNPPYIQPPDEKARDNYRRLFSICKGRYSLVAPFVSRFFQLCRIDGHTGMIVGNAFMTRIFGGPVVELLRSKQVDLIVDTKNLNIAGHGTPTVIITGRNCPPAKPICVAVNLEAAIGPASPTSPAWLSLCHVATHPGTVAAGAASELVSGDELWRHPVVLVSAPERAIMKQIATAEHTFMDVVGDPGLAFVTGEEEAYLRPESWLRTRPQLLALRPLIDGVRLRDWRSHAGPEALIFPYDSDGTPDPTAEILRALWPQRRLLETTLYFGRQKHERRLKWFEYAFLSKSRIGQLRITYPLVTDYAHFCIAPKDAPYVLDHSAPSGVTLTTRADDMTALNSSTAWFWMKRTFFAKGHDDPEQDFHEVDATKVSTMPLAIGVRASISRRLLDAAAQPRTPLVSPTLVPSDKQLTQARNDEAELLARLVTAQEELDWDVYRLHGFLQQDVTYDGHHPPGLAPGERAFEIALARRVAAGEENTSWFARHGSTPITEIPKHWPEAYRALVQRRLELIANNPSVRLLEKPEHKRRWAAESWDKRAERALRGWLLDRLEDRQFWFDGQGRPTPRSVAQLADDVARDADLMSVLALWEGRRDAPVTESLVRLLEPEAVPYLAAYRHKEPGLRKRGAWEQTWALQRREDGGEAVGTIPVPPKYSSADFTKASYWQARGKLDVPKERFVLYPAAGRETDPTPLLGWAGWDHAQQSLALSLVIGAREADGWDDARLIPLVAGLAELQPWVEQWHAEVDPTYGVSLAAFCRQQLTERMSQVGASLGELAAWRPEPARRGRTARTS